MSDVETVSARKVTINELAQRLNATKVLHDVMLELERGGEAPLINRSKYNQAELKEADDLHRRYLRRRIKEEASKAGYEVRDV